MGKKFFDQQPLLTLYDDKIELILGLSLEVVQTLMWGILSPSM